MCFSTLLCCKGYQAFPIAATDTIPSAFDFLFWYEIPAILSASYVGKLVGEHLQPSAHVLLINQKKEQNLFFSI